ncbi:hypothetical protein [Nitratireductor indicus]|uniref:hypothetical protein n=1 Tax=Nitratireductor indicus TaxID=721133 RepID=UPI002876DCE2|nr:hypothetical protein [Nitratireductor indicus]MDS1134858.1 hypothetical protein [Nitratireductor indicus]
MGADQKGAGITREDTTRWRQSSRALLPSPLAAVAGALLWGLFLGANAWVFLTFAEWHTPSRMTALVLLFFLGGTIAFPLGHIAYRLTSRRDTVEARFAAAFLSFAVMTIGVTAGLYALQYRLYYAQWHGSFLSVEWVLQFVFTTAGALYQFAVVGLRVYFPWGFAALFLLALHYAAKPR